MPYPPRRWFQFRLSTWFVLVGIVAWGMLYWPWVVTEYSSHRVLLGFDANGRPTATPLPPKIIGRSLQPGVGWPGLGLAAFVCWRLASEFGRRPWLRWFGWATLLTGLLSVAFAGMLVFVLADRAEPPFETRLRSQIAGVIFAWIGVALVASFPISVRKSQRAT